LKFSEFHAGQVLHAGPYSVSEAEVLDFAKQWDPQWFHTDPAAAARGPFDGLIASGWHTCGIAMRLAADAFLAGVGESHFAKQSQFGHLALALAIAQRLRGGSARP
jgi:acyl dehydratase